MNASLLFAGLALLRGVAPLQSAGVESNVDVSGCGETKGCVLLPTDCKTKGDCRLGATFRAIDNGEKVAFELFAETKREANHSRQYLALIFSNDSKVGSDPASACSYEFNSGESEVALQFRHSATRGFPVEHSDELSPKVLNLTEAGLTDRYFVCRFSQVVAHPEAADNAEVAKLDTQHFFLFVTSGPQRDKGSLVEKTYPGFEVEREGVNVMFVPETTAPPKTAPPKTAAPNAAIVVKHIQGGVLVSALLAFALPLVFG